MLRRAFVKNINISSASQRSDRIAYVVTLFSDLAVCIALNFDMNSEFKDCMLLVYFQDVSRCNQNGMQCEVYAHMLRLFYGEAVLTWSVCFYWGGTPTTTTGERCWCGRDTSLFAYCLANAAQVGSVIAVGKTVGCILPSNHSQAITFSSVFKLLSEKRGSSSNSMYFVCGLYCFRNPYCCLS